MYFCIFVNIYHPCIHVIYNTQVQTTSRIISYAFRTSTYHVVIELEFHLKLLCLRKRHNHKDKSVKCMKNMTELIFNVLRAVFKISDHSEIVQLKINTSFEVPMSVIFMQSFEWIF